MRLCLISDTHSYHRKAVIPECDVLIHAGDFMTSGWHLKQIVDFNAWLGQQPAAKKVVIAGNHDRVFEKRPDEARSLLTNAIYLENSGITVDGVKFWGSPVQPAFCDWAFNVERGENIRRYWDMIPVDTDVLITHGPPHGILDCTYEGGEHIGCEELAKAVPRVQPRLHVFGHIHGGAGQQLRGSTIFVNAAFVDEGYRVANQPTLFNMVSAESKQL